MGIPLVMDAPSGMMRTGGTDDSALETTQTATSIQPISKLKKDLRRHRSWLRFRPSTQRTSSCCVACVGMTVIPIKFKLSCKE
jgi:hypothetical protein